MRWWLARAGVHPGLLGLVAVIGACESRPRAGLSDERASGKLELFGDPSLVPTREGERIRRELAITGELEQALLALGLASVHVDVELREPTTVVVIARRGSDAEPSEEQIAAVVRAIIEVDPAQLRLFVLPAITEAPAPERRHDAWAIALLLSGLGLGLSLGVLGERLRNQSE